MQSRAVASSPLGPQKPFRLFYPLALSPPTALFPQTDCAPYSEEGIFSGWFRTAARTSTQDRAALDSQACVTHFSLHPVVLPPCQLSLNHERAAASPLIPRTQASLASAILKLKFSDFIAVHRRILATIWRLFCKWNSSAAVCALQNARRQAYSAATPDGRSTETDSSCAAASSSPVFASPADGSPQVSYMLHTLRPPPTPNNATVVIFELPLPPTNCRVSDYKSGEHCRFHAPVEVRAALVCFGVSIRRPCFRSQVCSFVRKNRYCFQASAGRCCRFQSRQPLQALCSVVLTFRVVYRMSNHNLQFTHLIVSLSGALVCSACYSCCGYCRPRMLFPAGVSSIDVGESRGGQKWIHFLWR